MPKPPRPADAVVFGGPVDPVFWSRHPDIEHVDYAQVVDEIEDRPPWEQWSLWLREPTNGTDALPKKWLGERRPDRSPDLTFDNAGHIPPPWFWPRHPDVAAFTIEYDPGDGGNWWAYIWTGAL